MTSAGAKDLPVEFFATGLWSTPLARRVSFLQRAARASAARVPAAPQRSSARCAPPPLAQVARQRQQLPGLQRGELRHHGRQRERLKAPARRLLQQGAEAVERAERAQVGCGLLDKGGPDGLWREGIRFQAVRLAVNAPARSQLVVLLPLGRA